MVSVLPDGPVFAGVLVRWNGNFAEVALPAGAGPELPLRSLVQMDAPDVIYLGQVAGHGQPPLVRVHVEHAVDRGALPEIDNAWHPAR